MSGWLGPTRRRPPPTSKPKPKRACILLWMNGGPSTIDLWDLKPGHENGGPYKEIETTAPGLKIGEHLPKIAKLGEPPGGHPRHVHQGGRPRPGTYLMRTGHAARRGRIQYPTLGSLVSKELGDPQADLPNFVSIAPQRFFARTRSAPASSARSTPRSSSATTRLQRQQRRRTSISI